MCCGCPFDEYGPLDDDGGEADEDDVLAPAPRVAARFGEDPGAFARRQTELFDDLVPFVGCAGGAC